MIPVIALIVGALAVLLHVYIFYMESVAWHRPAVWKRFGVRDQESADIVRPMAYNQGFYNLFLAIGAGVGLVLFAISAAGTNLHAVGFALAVFALGSMVAASLVLLSSGKKYITAAITQGITPLAALAFLIVSFVTGAAVAG